MSAVRAAAVILLNYFPPTFHTWKENRSFNIQIYLQEICQSHNWQN